uniref:RING-CH-type domain-containing protein n=1 Tax=Zea mays TaxID=4577 RepID=A0A804PZZ2_MAIZE
MEREEELPSSSSSLGYMMQCRVCHEEEDQGRATMESPCGCSGSLKRWCDEKGSTLCEICLQNFKPGYTMPPKKTPVVETAVTISEHEDMQHLEPPEGLVDGADYTRCSYAADQCATWCRSLAITFTIVTLAWHLVAVATAEAAEHCAFSLLTMYLLRAAGILLPLYLVMRMIGVVQSGQRQYRLQLLEEQRRNASTI